MLVMHAAVALGPETQTFHLPACCKAWGREREPTSLLSGVSLEPDAECGMYPQAG